MKWISILKKHPKPSTEDEKYFVLVFIRDPNELCTVTNGIYFWDKESDSYCWKTYCKTKTEGYYHNLKNVTFWCEIPDWIIGEDE